MPRLVRRATFLIRGTHVVDYPHWWTSPDNPVVAAAVTGPHVSMLAACVIAGISFGGAPGQPEMLAESLARERLTESASQRWSVSHQCLYSIGPALTGKATPARSPHLSRAGRYCSVPCLDTFREKWGRVRWLVCCTHHWSSPCQLRGAPTTSGTSPFVLMGPDLVVRACFQEQAAALFVVYDRER